MKWLIFVALLLSFLSSSLSQSVVSGTVRDKRGKPVFAANVYLKSMSQGGVTSDFEGNFNLTVDHLNDTLIVSFIGYETEEISIESIDITKQVAVVLKESDRPLEEIIITAKDPISEQFAVTKMRILEDVYLHPAAQGDPLKAVANLPISTTTDETANPSLRGSSPDKSRVVLNGVPIYAPVRASQLNNQGFFSLFNPEVIDNMYVYASNPPLTFGNTSAGLVEIKTKRDIESNQLQFSTSLASTGLFISQKVKKDISFVQAYGNYQFSDAFVGIQESKLSTIKRFHTADVGIHFHSKMGKKGAFNSFNYFIDESFSGNSQSFTYRGAVSTSKKRVFTVTNFHYFFRKGILSINSGTNNSVQSFDFGNINSNQTIRQVYSSVEYKRPILKSMHLQFGVSHDYHQNRFKDSIPTFYYALSPSSPSSFFKTTTHHHLLETYFYTNWNIDDRLTLSSGMRSNFPVKNQSPYFSSQLGLNYRINKKQRFLLSGGKYHNYSTPNFNAKSHTLLKSYQVALDYTFELKNTLLKSAAYFKNETGQQAVSSFLKTNKITTFGLEFFIEHNFHKHFKLSFSNAFVDQKITLFAQKYPGWADFDYLTRISVQYAHLKLFTLALVYMSRPGTFYNDITGGDFDAQTSFYVPIFSDNLYGARYGNYNRFDLILSKYIPFGKSALISFVSLNNVFDTKNQLEAVYSKDYSSKSFDFYQRRTVYFGAVWQLNY